MNNNIKPINNTQYLFNFDTLELINSRGKVTAPHSKNAWTLRNLQGDKISLSMKPKIFDDCNSEMAPSNIQMWTIPTDMTLEQELDWILNESGWTHMPIELYDNMNNAMSEKAFTEFWNTYSSIWDERMATNRPVRIKNTVEPELLVKVDPIPFEERVMTALAKVDTHNNTHIQICELIKKSGCSDRPMHEIGRIIQGAY